MLSRTAENLFWMARGMERAENTARMLDVSFRMSLLPSTIDKQALHFEPILDIAPGSGRRFHELYDELNHETIIRYVALEPENGGSIWSLIHSARENARAQRTAISSEAWESLNSTWLQVQNLDFEGLKRWGYRDFFDWVKERSHLFRGVVFGTMLHDDAFRFIRLGTFIERADNTARILDVKYHVLLPAGRRGRRSDRLLSMGRAAAFGRGFSRLPQCLSRHGLPLAHRRAAHPARGHAALAAPLLPQPHRHARRACRQEAAGMPEPRRPDLCPAQIRPCRAASSVQGCMNFSPPSSSPTTRSACRSRRTS